MNRFKPYDPEDWRKYPGGAFFLGEQATAQVLNSLIEQLGFQIERKVDYLMGPEYRVRPKPMPEGEEIES